MTLLGWRRAHFCECRLEPDHVFTRCSLVTAYLLSLGECSRELGVTTPYERNEPLEEPHLSPNNVDLSGQFRDSFFVRLDDADLPRDLLLEKEDADGVVCPADHEADAPSADSPDDGPGDDAK